jgi:hypothetical protein
VDCFNNGRIALGKGEDLAVEVLCRERPQHLAGRDPAGRQPEDNKVRRSCIERCAQLTNLDAFINGEAELAQNLSQELPNVVFAIRDADKRHAPSSL